MPPPALWEPLSLSRIYTKSAPREGRASGPSSLLLVVAPAGAALPLHLELQLELLARLERWHAGFLRGDDDALIVQELEHEGQRRRRDRLHLVILRRPSRYRR